MLAKPLPSAPPASPSHDVDVFALPLARPVPLTPPPRAFSPVYEQEIVRQPPSREHGSSLGIQTDDDCCPAGWSMLWAMVWLVVFQAFNCALGFVGFAIVATGLALSLGLLPLCGFGIVIFYTLGQTMYYLSHVDARIHNLLASQDADKIEFPQDPERSPLLPLHDPRSPSRLAGETGRSRFDEKSLRLLSPRTVLVMVYFGSVKLVVSLLSGLCLLVLVVSTLAFFRDNLVVKIDGFSTDQFRDSAWFYPGCLAAVVSSSLGLHALARVSQAATRYFCCEQRH